MKNIIDFINNEVIEYTKPMYEKNRQRLINVANESIDKYNKLFNDFVDEISKYNGMTIIDKDINQDYIDISIDNSHVIRIVFVNSYDIREICFKIKISKYNEFITKCSFDLYDFTKDSINSILSPIYYNYKLYNILEEICDVSTTERVDINDYQIYFDKNKEINLICDNENLTIFKEKNMSNNTKSVSTTGSLTIEIPFNHKNIKNFDKNFVEVSISKFMMYYEELTNKKVKYLFSKE